MNRLTLPLRGLVVFAALVVLVGCSPTVVAVPIGEEPLDSASGARPEVTPFVLDIVDESNDGQRLVIKGRLSAKERWSADEVVLRLTAIDDSGMQRTLRNKMSELLPDLKVLEPDRPADFTVALASPGLSNYQLEVLWGAEATGSSSAVTPPASSQPIPTAPATGQELVLRGLEVHRLPDPSCASPDECRVKFTITGEFFNAGRAMIAGVSLLTGFSDADKLDLQDQILENERRVEIQNMKLAPGGIRPFRMALETSVTPALQMAPRPVIRIVSVKTE